RRPAGAPVASLDLSGSGSVRFRYWNVIGDDSCRSCADPDVDLRHRCRLGHPLDVQRNPVRLWCGGKNGMSSTALFERTRFACTLNDASDILEVGNKAYNLHRMLSIGLQVPAGFVVTNTAFKLFCETKSNSLPQSVLEEVLELRYALLS